MLCGEKINTLSILWRNILNIEQEFFYKVDQVENITHKLNNRLGFCKTDQVGLKKPQTPEARPAKLLTTSGVLPSPRPTDLDSAAMQFMSPHYQPYCCPAWALSSLPRLQRNVGQQSQSVPSPPPALSATANMFRVWPARHLLRKRRVVFLH